jgi:predicted TIM-barrel fold metal-dependent hydrolase
VGSTVVVAAMETAPRVWAPSATVDVHQHLWPAALIDELRRRRTPPLLDEWTLRLDGEPDFAVNPDDHDVERRVAVATSDGTDVALVSLSSPLGIESLPPDEAAPLLAAYHDGVQSLPPPFRAWAAAGVVATDPDALERELERGCVGLQLPATAVGDAAGYERCAPLLDVLERRGQPLFVHPGAATRQPAAPAWWPALVSYAQQMHAAWYAFRVFGRPAHPRLRICFAMLAGLAPLHAERFTARAAERSPIDPNTFVETSSYGARAVDATVRELGIDVLVHGSDRPYAAPNDPRLGAAAARALRTDNPRRLLLQGGLS